jgi:hypothetical protein
MHSNLSNLLMVVPWWGWGILLLAMLLLLTWLYKGHRAQFRRWWLFVLLVGVAVLYVLWCFALGPVEGTNPLVAIGTLTVAVTAVFGDWLRARVIPPRLRLKIAPPVHTDVRDLRTGVKTDEAWYFGLDVVNLKEWRPARNCDVMLIAMHRVGPDMSLTREPIPVPLPLVWAMAALNPTPVTVR